MTRLRLPPKPRILVVVLRRLGDVLLTTPLMRSLRRAWPDAEIDALVFAGTEGILAGNGDITRVITMSERAPLAAIALVFRLWKHYDLAISTQPGDRPSFFAVVAGRLSVGLVSDPHHGRIKRRAHHRSVTVAEDVHRVEDVLRLADALGIPRLADIICPTGGAADVVPPTPYAVIHAAPMFRYKRWSVDGWRALATALAGRGLTVVATGGPSDAERRYLDEIWNAADTPVRRLDGRIDWASLTRLLHGARVFVGPDTVVTHLAAASGCPTVALYGPTDPRLWGPWPAGGLGIPWHAAGTRQRRGNVFLVQHPLACTPCQGEGCEKHIASYSRCLDELSVAEVVAAVDAALSDPAAPVRSRPPAAPGGTSGFHVRH